MIELLNLSPADGTAIQPNRYIEFDIRSTDVTPFLRILISFDFQGLSFNELAFAQDPAASTEFEHLYQQLSTVTPVVDAGWQRFHFKILRSPLWPDSPQLQVYAFNTAGEEL